MNDMHVAPQAPARQVPQIRRTHDASRLLHRARAEYRELAPSPLRHGPKLAGKGQVDSR